MFDFPDKELGKAIPVPGYTTSVTNRGLGQCRDGPAIYTAAFAVDDDSALVAADGMACLWRCTALAESRRTVAAPTPACNRLWKLGAASGSPMSWGWRYRCAISRPERASCHPVCSSHNIRVDHFKSTGCSVTLPRTGVDARW